MDELLKEVRERAQRYLATVAERPVAPSAEAVDALESLDIDLPDGPTDDAEVLRQLDTLGSPATVATAGPRYFGFVIGGTQPAALAANWLAGAWDQCPGLQVVSPTGAIIERIAGKWLVDVLGFPSDVSFGFVTGATTANFTGLAAARHHVLEQEGWDVEAKGLFGAPPITVVVGEEIHASAVSALGYLGLGRERVVTVPVDGQGRMLPDKLPKLDGPTIVCTQAGNVNTGAFDPIAEISDVAHEAGAWVHVDGAFGMWAAASPQFEHLTTGAFKADSWALDAHKWLNVPYDSGLVFCRYPEAHRQSMTTRAAYLLHGDRREPSEYTPELSRRARGIEVWAALLSMGRSGFAELIDNCCRHARRFAEGLSGAGFEILNDVVLNQVLVTFGDADKTNRVIDAIQRDGTCWAGGTQWQGHTAMRIAVSSWATKENDVEKSLDAIIRIANSV